MRNHSTSTATRSRRKIISAAACLVLATTLPQVAQAQSDYPNKPIRFLVGFAAGGSADAVARTVATDLSKALGQSVVVENKAGASAHLATQALLAAPADGYTILFAGLTLATNPPLMKSLGYDPLKDLLMVSQMTSMPVVVLAPAKSPLNNLQDLIAASKAKPGGLTFSSGGVGTSAHLGPELFTRATGIKYTHVPYRGGAPALQGLLSGDTEVMFDTAVTPMHKSMVQAGKVKFLGVMQKDPISNYPSIKSAGEQGIPPAAFMRSWQGVAVRSGTPPAMVAKLHGAIATVLKSKEISERINAMGMEVHASANPEEFQKLYLDELARWTEVIQAAGITAE